MNRKEYGMIDRMMDLGWIHKRMGGWLKVILKQSEKELGEGD